MPPDLLKAHRALDSALDTAYGTRKFTTYADHPSPNSARSRVRVASHEKPAAAPSRHCRGIESTGLVKVPEGRRA